MGGGGMGTGAMGGGGMGGGGGAGGGGIVCTDIVLDGSFEAGTPNANWSESSTLFGTPLCSAAGCNAAVGSGPRTGTWWYWGGGAAPPFFGSDNEISTVTQSVTIPAGTATLEWYMEMPNCDTGLIDFFDVTIDGAVLYQTNTLSEPSCGVTGYVHHTVNITAYADGGSHTIQFLVDQIADYFLSNDTTNVFVDDVVLTSCQ
jgi:hypothetical protein